MKLVLAMGKNRALCGRISQGNRNPLTSRAFSCPTSPAAAGLAAPLSSSPSPLTWLWAAMRCVFEVLFTSSIFIPLVAIRSEGSPGRLSPSLSVALAELIRALACCQGSRRLTVSCPPLPAYWLEFEKSLFSLGKIFCHSGGVI